VPTDAEWSTMINFLDANADGGNNNNLAGGKMKETGTSHWLSPNTGATNSNGFTGLPGGIILNDGTFTGINYAGSFWSSSENSTTTAWNRFLYSNTSNAIRNYYNLTFGYSVRCLSNQLLKTEDHAMKLQVKLYPNPATNTLHLQTATNSSLDKITITDLTGKVILTQTNNTTQINVELLASGMYIIEAVSGTEKFTIKFIKK